MILITETQSSYEFSRVTLSFLTVAIASLLVLPGLPRRVYLVSPIAVAITALAVLSMLWSDYSENALQNSLFVVAALYAATLVASTASTREIAWAIAIGQFAILVISVVEVLADPSSALVGGSYENGALRGVFGHRNLFAFFMLVGLAAALTIADETRTITFTKLALSSVFMTAIFLSSSATTIVVAVIVIGASALVLGLRRVPMRRRPLASVIAGGIVLVAVTIVLANIGAVLGALGREQTLTYRTVIWDVASKWAAERPLLGYGWDSVWGASRSPGREITAELALAVNHAHSIYVELWLTLGLVGVALLVFGLLIAFAYSTRGSLFGDGSALLWLNLTLVLAIHGLTETMLLRPAGLLLFFLLLARAVNDGGRPSPVTRILCLAISVRGGRPEEIWQSPPPR